MPVRTHSRADSITHDRLLALISYDPFFGEFTWLVKRNSHAGSVYPGDRVTGQIDRHGYRIIGLDGRKYMASRLAWFYVKKEWPIGEVDHKDRDPLNNRLDNLRDVGEWRGYNRANQKVKKDSKSGIKGVQWVESKKKWRARCCAKELGYFATAEEAHAAYLKEARKIFGEFARSK